MGGSKLFINNNYYYNNFLSLHAADNSLQLASFVYLIEFSHLISRAAGGRGKVLLIHKVTSCAKLYSCGRRYISIMDST